MEHQDFLQRCLEIAEGGRHLVGNGVLVGAVLVRDGTMIAEGIHRGYGKVHAERELLQNFDQEIRSTDILYTSLEPCCHHGKTPPCTDILLERGIKTIVYGMEDPDARMAGKGNEILRNAGVKIIGPVLRAECEYFSRGFVSVRTNGRPFITLKQALARDGSFANPDGSPKKITDQLQDTWTHTHLRFPADGIVVGVNTILRDDPKLNTRFAQKNALQKAIIDPYRIVLDPDLETPVSAQIVTDELAARTIIVIRDDLKSDVKAFAKNDVRIIRVPFDGTSFDFDALFTQLITPCDGYDGLTSLLIEGGARTWKMFRDAGVVDEEVLLLGDE